MKRLMDPTIELIHQAPMRLVESESFQSSRTSQESGQEPGQSGANMNEVR